MTRLKGILVPALWVIGLVAIAAVARWVGAQTCDICHKPATKHFDTRLGGVRNLCDEHAKEHREWLSTFE